MEIRSITIGSKYPKDNYSEVEKLAKVAKELKRQLEDDGIKVQNIRYSTQYWNKQDYSSQVIGEIKLLEKRLKSYKIDYSSIGTIIPDASESTYQLLPQIIQNTETIFSAVTIAQNYQLDDYACRKAAEIILKLSTVKDEGFGNLYFSALANVPPHAPFFPGGYHIGDPGLSIGCQFVDLIYDAFSQSENFDVARKNLHNVLTNKLKLIEEKAMLIAQENKSDYYGIDVSVAPAPGEKDSIAYAIEKLGFGKFGEPGTLTICAMITQVLKSLPLKMCGYSGLMLPILEDSGLAQRYKEGLFNLDNLLLYSSVCGTGLDVIPLSGDISEEKIYKIILDTATLSCKLKKPLSVRLMPIPGKKVGDKTTFRFSYFANTTIRPV